MVRPATVQRLFGDIGLKRGCALADVVQTSSRARRLGAAEHLGETRSPVANPRQVIAKRLPLLNGSARPRVRKNGPVPTLTHYGHSLEILPVAEAYESG